MQSIMSRLLAGCSASVVAERVIVDPLQPRPKGGMSAEGLKKQISSSRHQVIGAATSFNYSRRPLLQGNGLLSARFYGNWNVAITGKWSEADSANSSWRTWLSISLRDSG
jgi:hypothetical protein